MTYILYSVYKLFQSGIWIYFFQCKLIIKLFSDTTRPLQQIKKAYGNLGVKLLLFKPNPFTLVYHESKVDSFMKSENSLYMHQFTFNECLWYCTC